jgi:hypothetical protein
MLICRAFAALLVLAFAAACGRTAPETSAEKALAAARSAQELADAAATTADNLVPRVEANEGGVASAGERLDQVENDIAALKAGQSTHDLRLGALELGGGGLVDQAVLIPEPAVAGFTPAEGVTNVRQGFAVLNQRVDAQDARVAVLETGAVNLPATVVQVVNEQITAGTINVQLAEAFTPPPVDVDPRADPADAYPEYSQSATLQQVVTALRFSNQVLFQAPAEDTRLLALYDGTVRSYVQEAIATLDKDLYDLFAGNASPALDTTSLPQDGRFDDVQSAVESLFAGAGAQPYILGAHPTPSAGALSSGDVYGIEAGTALCQDAFAEVATAHLCGVEEAQRALGQNRYAGIVGSVVAWAPVFEGDSCEGLLSALPGANGASLTVDLAYSSGSGRTGKRAFVTRGVACDTELAVLCCR